MTQLRVLYSDSYDPWFNLAVEETIFNNMSGQQKVLFLWRNDNTVVIGRAQNPWKECNTAKMEQDHIKLARRSSGGGAVFHDLGNTNFTFMAAKPDYDKSISTQIILNALASLGINAEASGRNDLVINSNEGLKKISGSAYRETADRGFHHGTLLLNANLSRLADYLNPDAKKLQAKGISSVRSRVCNLVELKPTINHAQICQAITEAFLNYYQTQANIECISPLSPPDLPGFEQKLQIQTSWQWNFGKAPAFSHLLSERFIWGGVDIHFDINDGFISQAKIFTDSLVTAPLENLARQIVGQPYQAANLKKCCLDLIDHHPQQQSELIELADWIYVQTQ